MKTVLFVDKEGNVSGLTDDVIDRLDLGRKEVNRVSDVEFNHNMQIWEARDLHGALIAYGPVRSDVIQAERDYFNNRLKDEFSLAK